MEIINLDVSLPTSKSCEEAAGKYKLAVMDTLHEIFEQGIYEIKLKTLQPADGEQQKARETFLNSVAQNLSIKVDEIQEEAYEMCTTDIYQEESGKKQGLERKDCFDRTLVHFLKRLSPLARGLTNADAIESKAGISYPVLIGLIVLLKLGSNRNDRQKIEQLCEKYAYLHDNSKCFKWGGEDETEPGIYNDEQIKILATDTISKIARSVIGLDKSEIIKKISLSDSWNKNERVKFHDLTEKDIEELVDVLKNIA